MEASPGKEYWKLWAGLLLPALAWAVQLETVYLLSEHGCAGGSFAPVHIVSMIALFVAICGCLLSWRNWQKAGGNWKSEEAGSLSRSRFMAILGVLSGALFLLVIVAQWLPTLMGVPCDK